MRFNLVSTTLVIATGLALSAIAVPASAATSSCASMFSKAEKMAGAKNDVAKKVKGYQMAIEGYQTCSKALAMANGAERDTMMKKAEAEFEAAYEHLRTVE
jgi:hypothetical protein